MTCEENGLSCAARGEEGALEGSRDIARRVGVTAHDDVSVETWHTLRFVKMICGICDGNCYYGMDKRRGVQAATCLPP